MVEKFLEGKGVLITGGASGFGRGVALDYAKRGADLVLVDINEKETKKRVIPIVCDVSDANQVSATGKQAFKELDNIFVLFNNAGIGFIFGKSLLRVPEDIWDKEININLKGQWLVAKALWRKMNSQKFEPLAGKMIHTSSVAGMVADPDLPVYSIAKAGVMQMVQILAKTLAPKISVNAIAPGYLFSAIAGSGMMFLGLIDLAFLTQNKLFNPKTRGFDAYVSMFIVSLLLIMGPIFIIYGGINLI